MTLRFASILRRTALAVLGTLGLIGPPAEANAKANPAASADESRIQNRIDRARDRLIKELGAKEISSEKAGKVAQWYNWPNWGNWFNGWRNW